MVIAEVSILGAPDEAVVPPVAPIGDMWVHDNNVGTLRLYTIDGGEVATIDSPILGDDCQGMDYRDGFLWLRDDDPAFTGAGRVWKVDVSDGSATWFPLGVINQNIYTLAKTPDGMWLFDSAPWPLQWLKVSDTGTELSRINHTTEPVGSWYTSTFDGTYLWATINQTYREPPRTTGDLLRFDPSGPSETVLTTDLPTLWPYFVTFDGTDLVVLRQYNGTDPAGAEVYTVDRGTGTSTLLGHIPGLSGPLVVAWVR